MANEELTQRGFLSTGALAGSGFGPFEVLDLGATTVDELMRVGLRFTAPSQIDFPFKKYKKTKKPGAARPDVVYTRRTPLGLHPVAVSEFKQVRSMDRERAGEQALHNAAALGVHIGIISDGATNAYVDVSTSLSIGQLAFFDETRNLNPGVLENLLNGDAGVVKDPKPLAESVWQLIWHATKANPEECLLTFVEIFVLKFLSDNLPTASLPAACSFYELTQDPAVFHSKHGKSSIEYYVKTIRPQIKSLFPDQTVVSDPTIPRLFGLQTIVSKTSVINGFAFLRSSDQALTSFDRTFSEVLEKFENFGPLTEIDPEFKMRLYETFLKRSARQQKLGQFFTPRNVVRSMITMAELDKLADNSVLLDPAAGPGGFILEPLLIEKALESNISFKAGKFSRRVKAIGIDLIENAHILAKANMLIHLAEAVRDPNTTVDSLNQALADTFILMNSNETLGSLEFPPRNVVDVILTNPPYVTKGSSAYKDEIANTAGLRNGVDLREYYDRWGLGLEALFLRYISGALKPGGRALLIVPLGMLNRTDPGPKRRMLMECNIVASIALPRNTFFNTAQLTYILVIEKRRTEVDPRPDVFCALPKTIGETLDFRRFPTPGDNQLQQVAEFFVKRSSEMPHFVKLVAANKFSENDRWDVQRFWSDDELVELGLKEAAVDRDSFVDEVFERLTLIDEELTLSKEEIRLAEPPESERAALSLSDNNFFEVYAGARLKTAAVKEHPGTIPVYSCFKNSSLKKGDVDEHFLIANGFTVEEEPFVSINANGASVGMVFVRRDRCFITDDVILVRSKCSQIDIEYLAYQIKAAVAAGGFLYEAKLFKGRVLELDISIPKHEDGSFDIERQQNLAAAYRRFDSIREKLGELGKWSMEANLS